MFQLSWIDKNIAVGSEFDNADLPKIKKLGVNAIIDLRTEAGDDQAAIEGMGMRYLHVFIEDRHAPTPQQMAAVMIFSLPLLRANKKIFIHCKNGFGRSPLVAISLMVERGMSASEALQQAKKRHSDMAFTQEQEKYIKGLIETSDGDEPYAV